ncbi:MAG TPA: TetR/AcrR family transcriptional regulator [Candidatus Limnocylindrales bacterium]|nr:TetR/AcrR family transcriptional regulator [Candidatus Limnocylindrales bacterium]
MVTEPNTTDERRTPLTRDRVLQAAVDLADRGGNEALSMRKLGQELGVDAMALYRHVRGKDDLLDGLVEVIVGQIERPTSGGDWRANLREQAMAARNVMLSHPWARRVLEERGTGGPACLAYVESVLATLHDGGFSIELAHHALHVLSSRIFGFTQDLFEEPGPADPPPDAAAMLRALAGYPRVVELAMAASHEGVLGPCDDDVEFAFGLDLTLDGLERVRAGA